MSEAGKRLIEAANEALAIASSPKKVAKVTFREQIKRVLEQEHRPMSAAEVAGVLGMSVHRVTGPMSKLAAYGEIEVVERFKAVVRPTIYKAKDV